VSVWARRNLNIMPGYVCQCSPIQYQFVIYIPQLEGDLRLIGHSSTIVESMPLFVSRAHNMRRRSQCGLGGIRTGTRARADVHHQM